MSLSSFFNFVMIPVPPLALPLASLLAGILAGYWQFSYFTNYCIWSFVLSFLVFKNYKTTTFKNSLLKAMICLAIFLASKLNFTVRMLRHQVMERDLIGSTASMQGIVVDSWYSPNKNGNCRQTLLIAPYHINGSSKVPNLIKLFSNDAYSSYAPGDKVYCSCIRSYSYPHPVMSTKAHKIAHSRSEGVLSFTVLKNITLDSAYKPTDTWIMGWPVKWVIWINKKRRALLNASEKILSAYTSSLYKTVFLGLSERSLEINQQVATQFLNCGIAHYLARSGIHIAVLLIALHKLLQCIPLPFALKRLLILIALGIYALLSWFSLPFLRAFLYYILKELYGLLFLPFSALHTLTLVCFLLVAYNPFYIFFIDFQLTFCITFVLISLYEAELAHTRLKFL